MANSYYGGAGDAPNLADESTRGEMDELLTLLEEKDADLRRAAELGKHAVSRLWPLLAEHKKPPHLPISTHQETTYTLPHL